MIIFNIMHILLTKNRDRLSDLCKTKNKQTQIFLIGYMGSGKTTYGKRIAKSLNYKFIDLDNFLETQEKKL